MKKTKTSSAALILAALLLSSCAGEIAGGTAAAPAPDTTAAPAEKQTSADTAPTETTPVETTTAASSDTAGSASSPAESEKPSAAELLTPGVWWATSAFEEDCYYTFGEDGSGSLIFQDMGTGVGMDYAPEGSSCTFHLGSADNVTTAGVEADGDGIILRWEDGRVEYLTYMGAEEDFSFYSSTDLAEMAKWYCRDNNGGYEPSEADTSIDGSGLISIHLFDIADGHTATEAWYYIDRFTARGEDMNGEPVDLAPYGQTYDGDGVIAAHGGTQGSAPFEKLRKEISDAGALFGVKYLGYIAPEANDPEVFGSYIDHILSYTGALEVCGLDDGYMLSYYDFISTSPGKQTSPCRSAASTLTRRRRCSERAAAFTSATARRYC